MVIQYLGHSCFRLTEKETSMIIDPFSKEIGLDPPKIKDNLILVTHKHYDHAEIKNIPEGSVLVDGPGEYEFHNIYIRGIQSFHDNSKGAERGLNTMYVVEIDEIKICHMGDFGEATLEENQIEEIGDVDVLMIPVGGKYTIDGKQATEAIRQIEPKIIIPMHFKVPGLKIDIDGPEKFLKELGLKPEVVDKLRISKKTLPVEEMKLYMFS